MSATSSDKSLEKAKPAAGSAGAKRGLGRGLNALFGDEAEDYAALDKVRSTKSVPVELIRPGRYQPRRVFTEEAIEELAQSIRAKGVLQPLLVRRDPEDLTRYELIAGERRWRAAQRAQLHEVPVIIRDMDDREAAEISLVENIQRADLSPLEEAEGYKRLIEEFQYTQEDLAKAVGKSRSHVANSMRLIGLPDPVRAMLLDGKLSAGHARCLVNRPDAENLARKIVDQGLSVRQTEKLVQAPAVSAPAAPSSDAKARPRTVPRPSSDIKDPNIVELEQTLSDRLGLVVAIEGESEVGQLVISYRSLDQLDEVVRLLSAEI
jgi:ParB family transcriptional regulator, chromosome partitioning protein